MQGWSIYFSHFDQRYGFIRTYNSMSVNSSAQIDYHTRLNEPWLTLCRVGWLLISATGLSLFERALPTYYDFLHHVCAGSGCFEGVQLNFGQLIVLARIGIHLEEYALNYFILSIAASLVTVAIGIFLFIKKSNDWLVLLISLFLVNSVTGSSNIIAPYLFRHPEFVLPGNIIYFVVSTCLILFFLLFPTGKFTPRWTIGLAVFWGLTFILGNFFPDTIFYINKWPDSIKFFYYSAIILTGIVAQVIKNLKLSSLEQRLQTKWVVFGVSLGWGGGLLIEFIRDIFPGSTANPYSFIGLNILDVVVVTLIPIAVLIAILRNHLWDIDVIIRRTLVYGLLTTSLLLIYFLVILLLEQLLRLMTGQTSPVAVIVSTLMIAAMFNPMRLRIQSAVDKRFYRSKYDAACTLEEFSSGLRTEVDLEQLTHRLTAVVKATMQPDKVSVWLKPVKAPKNAFGTLMEKPITVGRKVIK
jgi:hypothetical protein